MILNVDAPINSRQAQNFCYIRIAELYKLNLPQFLDKDYIRYLNNYIFQDMQKLGVEYSPGQFRNAVTTPGELNVSSRELQTESLTIYSMRSFMDTHAIERFDDALKSIDTNYFSKLTTKEFSKEISSLYGLLDYTHPFPDGNSRTFRTFLQQVAHASGFNMDWDKIAGSRKLRDALYCARSIEVNLRALSDPAQAVHKNYIDNMLLLVSDKDNLQDLFRKNNIINPQRALVFQKTVNNCLRSSGSDFNDFATRLFQQLNVNLSSFPEITKALQVFVSCVQKEAASPNSETRSFGNFYYGILPAFFTLLQQGETDISYSRLEQKTINLLKLNLSRHKDNQKLQQDNQKLQQDNLNKVSELRVMKNRY